MSLINDALRRARHEANREEALRKGGPMPPREVAQRRPGRRGSMAILVVLGVALGVALAGGGVALLGGRRAAGPATVEAPAETAPVGTLNPSASSLADADLQPSDTAASPPAVAAAPLAGASMTPPPEAVPVTGQEVLTSGEPVARQPDEAIDRPAATGPSPQREPEQAAIEQQFEPDLSPLAPAWPATPTAAPSASVRSFVHQAELTGGGAIELGGIAWSESGPSFALLNGRVTSPGEYVEGYKILQINPDQVELEADGDRLLIRLK